MTACHICSKELISIEFYQEDHKIKPCNECLSVIQKCVEQMEARDRRKAQKEAHLWFDPVTGEYSLDEFDETELDEFLDNEDSEILDGFHLVDFNQKEEYNE